MLLLAKLHCFCVLQPCQPFELYAERDTSLAVEYLAAEYLAARGEAALADVPTGGPVLRSGCRSVLTADSWRLEKAEQAVAEQVHLATPLTLTQESALAPFVSVSPEVAKMTSQYRDVEVRRQS